MSDRLYRSLQSLILVLLGLFLLNKIVDGSVFWYINARFLPLTLIGAVGLIWLARSLLSELRLSSPGDSELRPVEIQSTPAHVHGHSPQTGPIDSGADHSDRAQRSPLTLLVLSVPLLLGVLVPARALGASAIDNKGISAVAPRRAASSGAPIQLELLPRERNVLDWVRAFNQAADATIYQDQPADLIGFIYHDPHLPSDQFLLARFTLTCCVADAAAVGVIVAWPQGDQLPINQWVRVQGPVQLGELDGNLIPLVEAASVEAVPEPAQPYLFN